MTRTPDEIDIHADDVTVNEAAAIAGVNPDTIHKWKRRGHLPVAGRGPRGVLLFRTIDIAKAEAATREKARRP